jgi:cytochrome P450
LLKRHAAVVYETLRLFPTVPSFPRECAQDVVLKKSNVDICKGSLVLVSQMPMNMNPKIWDAPDTFNPDRFLGVGELQMSKPVGVPGGDRYAFAPFGGGARTCVGQRMGA